MFKLSIRTLLLALLTLTATHQTAQAIDWSTAGRVLLFNGGSLGVGAAVQTALRNFTDKYGPKLAEYGPKAKKLSPVVIFSLSLAIPFGTSKLMGYLPIPGGAHRFLTGAFISNCARLGMLLADFKYEDKLAQAQGAQATV